MVYRLSPAFSKHLKSPVKPSANKVPGQKQEEEAVRRATSLHMQGRLREAEQLCLKILSQNPRNAQALYVAGRIALDVGDEGRAEHRFKMAVEAAPREPVYLVALADILKHDRESAIKLYLQALSIQPNMLQALSGLSRAYVASGCEEDAVALWEKILRLDAKHETARVGLAEALISLGRMDEAAASLRESIRLGKAVDAAYSTLARTQKFTSEPPELKAILSKLESPTLEPRTTSRLHYAAGKILNDLQLYDDALEQFKKANLISDRDFNLDTYRQIVNLMIETFSPTFLSSKVQLGNPTDVPVFIVGMPRSGTTLAEQICASHPSVFGAGELRSFRRIARHLGFGRNPREFSTALSAMTPKQAQMLSGEYLGLLRKSAPQALRIVDKMPHNFELVGLIALLFPNARIIHSRRDAIDNCISCFVTSFRAGHGYKSDLTTLGLYYREYDRLMRHWNAVLPGRLHEIRYEAVIADQEAESRRLVEFLGLPWDDACLRFEENDRVVLTASRWQVRQPLYKTSVKRWKNYENKIQPLIEALGDLAEL